MSIFKDDDDDDFFFASDEVMVHMRLETFVSVTVEVRVCGYDLLKMALHLLFRCSDVSGGV